MTRQKKSRKPGPLAPRAQPRQDTEHPVTPGKKTQRRKGRKPGARHNVSSAVNSGRSAGGKRKQQDPRIGSKKPVPLGHPEQSSQVPATPQSAPAEDTQASLWEAFQALEQDETLQALLAQQDAGETLTPVQAQWLGEQLDRYAELAAQLGVDLSAEDEETSSIADWDQADALDEWRQE